MHTDRSRQPGGFTLIELLVVVAIIALLISILLPSLSAAREGGKRTKCLSNMKNLMTATNTYFVDNKDVFPMISRQTGFCNFIFGGKTNSDFWKSGGGPFYMPASQRPMNRYMINRVPGDNDEMKQFSCPSERVTHQRQNGRPSKPTAYNDVGTSYLFNWAMVFDTNWQNQPNGLNDVGKPDRPTDGIPIGWYRLGQKLVRESRGGYTGRLIWYYEETLDYPLTDKTVHAGDLPHHNQYGMYVLGFLDGHGAYKKIDIKQWCGEGWMAINPYWIKKDNPTSDVWYTSAQKNCDPKK